MNLKPCPFCSFTKISIKAYEKEPGVGFEYAECDFCHARGPEAMIGTYDDVEICWNMRDLIHPLTGKIERPSVDPDLENYFSKGFP